MRCPIRSARGVLPGALAVWLVLPAVPQGGHTENGLASWYGYPYHGHSSASGEVYDMDRLTAAHPTLPFNTVVRVVNLVNEKSIQVRITDRGPFVDGRIIDLSRAAAESIGMIAMGIAPVRVEVVGVGSLDRRPLVPPGTPRPVVPAPGSPAIFAVQTGAFRDRGNAERYRGLMRSRYGAARLVAAEDHSGVWRVILGSGTTREAADALTACVRRDSGENNAFVVRLDFSK